MNVNSATPAEPSATWFRWNAGQMIAHVSRNFGSGMKMPDSHSIGRNTMLRNAGADEPDAYAPMSRLIAQKGTAPTIMTTVMMSNWPIVRLTVSARIAAASIEAIARAPKIIDTSIFAIRYAPPGAGSARLSFRKPAPRSSASAQPAPKSEADHREHREPREEIVRDPGFFATAGPASMTPKKR